MQKLEVRFERVNDDMIDGIVAGIENMKRDTMQVEDIQDIIEQKLMAAGKFDLAKKYIIYRYTRELVRKANTTDDSIMSLLQNSNKDVMEENSNKNAYVASTQREFDCRRGVKRFDKAYSSSGENHKSA